MFFEGQLTLSAILVGPSGTTRFAWRASTAASTPPSNRVDSAIELVDTSLLNINTATTTQMPTAAAAHGLPEGTSVIGANSHQIINLREENLEVGPMEQ